MNVKVIAVGSPFGTDRIAWLALDLLQHEYVDREVHCEFIQLDRPGVGLLGYFERSDVVVIVDACLSTQHPLGSILRFDAHELVNPHPVLSSHSVELGASLTLAEALGILPMHCRVVAIVVDESAQLPSDHDVRRLAQATRETLEQLTAEYLNDLKGVFLKWLRLRCSLNLNSNVD